jgi:hypothetical protein
MHHDSFVSTTLPTRTQTLRICFLYHVLFYAAARPLLLYVYRGLGFSLVSCIASRDEITGPMHSCVVWHINSLDLDCLARCSFHSCLPCDWVRTYVRTSTHIFTSSAEHIFACSCRWSNAADVRGEASALQRCRRLACIEWIQRGQRRNEHVSPLRWWPVVHRIEFPNRRWRWAWPSHVTPELGEPFRQFRWDHHQARTRRQ